MSVPLVVIFTGFPCTGKTTLARQVARHFYFPFIYRDGIKERLFDTLGWQDRQWSKRLGTASYELLYYFLEEELAAGRSLVIESNFPPQAATPKFLDFKRRYPFEPLQFFCVTQDDMLFQRFVQRSESGERHPGHVDSSNYAEFHETLRQGKMSPLDIGGQVIQVDTTDFNQVNLDAIFAAVAARLEC